MVELSRSGRTYAKLEFELRKKARALTEHSLFFQTESFDVTVAVKDRKRVSMLQNASSVVGAGGFSSDVKILG